MGQVGDIAPLQLLGRQGELEELAAWCTGGDEAYAWWQAGPRAGKSALMAWLVLHPPPGTWVVSFFVTARLAGQADSAAFTGSMLDQLAAITGEQVPPVTSAAARDGLRRRLLESAAAKAGRRLVLVVDGLDEDCGSLPGSGLASIAACLPKRPPAGLRVIVAGRPDPPVPADVDDDHPLRRCRVRRLDVSPHATQAAELAQRELDEVLATDKNRHDGLGYEVLGLVTASGGGLGHRDLQDLTGRPAFEIDRLLRGVFGRTVAGRAGPDGEERVFLFTHETLREQAVGRLGAGALTGFAARLHDWADGYRDRGWPAGTPAYLLRGYPRMLADAGDLDGLVALATDSARHHRMLDATGGDAAALAEITAAVALVSTGHSPDLLAALRLAWYRDQLAARNTYMPAELPAVWATLGQPARADALARSKTNPYWQARALAMVAEAVARAGDHDRARALAADAERVARSITNPDEQAVPLAMVAEAVARAGDHDRARALAADAERVARSITNPYKQARTRPRVAQAAARALARVAEAAARAGDHERARALTSDAERVARSITYPDLQARALVSVAEAVTRAGDHERARALTADAERVARSITRPWEQTRALASVAEAAARAGDHERARALTSDAERVARSITNPYEQAGVAEAVAQAGDHDRAERVARSITDPDVQARALARGGGGGGPGGRSRPRRAGRPVHHQPGRAGPAPGLRGRDGNQGRRSRPRSEAGRRRRAGRPFHHRPGPAGRNPGQGGGGGGPGRRSRPREGADRRRRAGRPVHHPPVGADPGPGQRRGGGSPGGRSRPRRAGRPVHHRPVPAGRGPGQGGGGGGPGRRSRAREGADRRRRAGRPVHHQPARAGPGPG